MEDKWNLFQKFLITENANISISDFLLNSLVVVILSLLLSYTYRKCGRSLSNRKGFAANFILLAFTTMLIITIVKSSLALSLGLVGALSIVRFRAAIKEPEELAYLFIAIALGLGLGANQTLIVLVAFAILMLILWGGFFFSSKHKTQNLYISLSSDNIDNFKIEDLNNLIAKHFGDFRLKRYDSQNNFLELAYLVELKNTKSIQYFQDDLKLSSWNFHLGILDQEI
ncbi:MAG: DUF4956 domain-containing protein [Bacteroidales bacterium]|nr:DUF4956 domain-containing protein [Bacteroidales bacterium]